MTASERRRPFAVRFAAVGAAILLSSGLAAADAPAGAPAAAAAQALFDEGKRLLEEGQVGAACEKLSESLALDYGMGTQFKLGDCYERLGRTASAWSAFLEVAAYAKRQGDAARESVARERAERLEPTLPRLRVVVTSPVEGLRVTRGGVAVGQGQWGMALPTDAGDYEIAATAPGRVPFSTKVTVHRTGAVTVTIPELDAAPNATPAKAAGAPRGAHFGGDEASPAEITAWAMLGLGAVGVGVGSVAGIVSMSKASDAEPHCNGSVCDAEGVALRDAALTAGDVSTGAFIIGLAAAAGGAALWITMATTGDPAAETAALGVGPGTLSLRGTF